MKWNDGIIVLKWSCHEIPSQRLGGEGALKILPGLVEPSHLFSHLAAFPRVGPAGFIFGAFFRHLSELSGAEREDAVARIPRV
jgi:hypothetical protein